jgi:hypothetical protein
LRISVPEFPTSYLQRLEPITTFVFNKGGCFLHDKNLSLTDVVGILNVFCELVNINKVTSNNRGDMSSTYSVVPSLMIDLAKRARAAYFGYRLLKRCIRHAMDSYACDIIDAKVDVVKVHGEIYLTITHKVRASMKQDVYDVIACFNNKTVLACQCSCKCGSNQEEKIMCIHILPVMYQVSLFLYDGLGEHVLIELSSYVSSMNATDMTDANAVSLIKIVCSLILAVKKISPIVPEDLSCWYTLKSLLSHYNVSTNKFRRPPRSPTDREKLQPLKLLDRRSTVRRAHQHISTVREPLVPECTQNDPEVVDTENEVNDDDPDFLPPLSPNQYTTMKYSLWEVCRQLQKRSGYGFLDKLIGYQVIAHRSIGSLSYNTITQNCIPSSTTRNVMTLINVANGIDPNSTKRPLFNQSHNKENTLSDTTPNNNNII